MIKKVTLPSTNKNGWGESDLRGNLTLRFFTFLPSATQTTKSNRKNMKIIF